MNSKKVYYILVLLLVFSSFVQAQQLKVFSTIPGRTASDKYICKVREVGNPTWQDAFVIQSKSYANPSETGAGIDNGFFKELLNWSASYIAFEFENTTVEVEISKKDGSAITKVPVVRPAGDATAIISGGKAYITFTKRANVNVDIDGQMEDRYTGDSYTDNGGAAVHTMAIFANPIFSPPVASASLKVRTVLPSEDIRTINRTDWDAVIFAPGVHNIGTQLDIQTGEIFYIPGDAILKGTFLPNSAVKPQNIQVYGSGAISGEDLIWGTSSRVENKVFTGSVGGARLEGFVAIDPTNHTFNMGNTGTVTNVYKNLKIFGWRKNSDGVNAFENSEVSDCFFRVQDDAFYLGSNVKIHDITTWTDANGAVMYLAKSDKNSYFKDIKVIYNRKKTHYWNSGVISMRDTDGNIENVICQNINVEDPFPTVGLFYGTISTTKEPVNGCQFNNVVFENITQAAMRRDGKKMDLLGTTKSIWKNITIKNCKYRGTCLSSLDDGNWNYNANVEKASIKFQCADIAVTSVSVSPSSLSIAKGETAQLTATALPAAAGNQNVSWSSSNGAIATVDANGLVTAKATGPATITATTIDGNKMATSAITVTPPPPCSLPWTKPDFTITNINNNFKSGLIDISCASAVTISMDLSEIDFFESTDKLTVSYKLDEGQEVLIRELINDFNTPIAINVPNLSGNILEILIKGVTDDAAEIYYIKNLKVTDSNLSTHDNKLTSNTVKVYPNPVSGILNIDSETSSEKVIKVINSLGQVVSSTKSSGNAQIDIQSLNINGFVIVQVIADGKVSNHKVIVK